MIIRGKKYRVANGLALDLDADLQLMQKELAKGWRLEKFFLWWFVFEKSKPAVGQYAIDYFDGDATELTDYLETYKLAGWHLVLNKQYYYVFQGDMTASPIYTDVESFKIRQRKERFKMCLQCLWLIPLGLSLYYLRDLFLTKGSGLYEGTSVLAFFLWFYPIVIPGAILIYSGITKLRRKQGIGVKRDISKKRRVIEMVIYTLLMAGLGGVIGFLMANYIL